MALTLILGRQVVLLVYEVVAFQALRDRLKCKEIWVVGADRWRNPDEHRLRDLLRAARATGSCASHTSGHRAPIDMRVSS